MSVILIDGGLGTELTDMGYSTENAKFWSGKWLIENSDIVKKAHLNFIENGCKIIETSSYQLSVDDLVKENHISFDDAKDIIRKSVRVADQARKESKQDNILIAGSIGPYGASKCDGSEYDGSYANEMTLEYLMDWHRVRLECLLEADCDLLAIETMPSIKEALAVTTLLASYPNAKAWLAFSCKDESHLCNGETFKDAYNKFKDNPQVVAIGINCSSPYNITGLLKSVISENISIKRPFIVYANDGRLWDALTQKFVDIEGDSVEPVCNLVQEWIDLGTKFVGGCCNIGSKDMKKINERITIKKNTLKIF